MEPVRSRFWHDVSTAGAAARDASRVLRRHPSLLLLPLLLAVFSAVQSGATRYLTYTHTGFGRWSEAQGREREGRQPQSRASVWRPVLRTIEGSSLPSAGLLSSVRFVPDASGVTELLMFRVWDAPPDSALSGWLLLAAILPFLGYPVGALIVAGYYAVLEGARDTGVVAWPRFWHGARRFMPHVLLYFLLYMIISTPYFVLIMLAHAKEIASWAIPVSTLWRSGLEPLLLLSLALVPVAVVADDLRFATAVRRSIVTVWKHLGTAITLAAETVVLYLLVAVPYQVASSAFRASRYGPAPEGYLNAIPLFAVYEVALAVVMVWAVLALFSWYREAYPAPALAPYTPGPQETPAESAPEADQR